MRKISFLNLIVLIAFSFAIISCNQTAKTGGDDENSETTENTETVEEEEEPAWEPVPEVDLSEFEQNEEGEYIIFDGTSSKGWRGFKKTEMPERWSITENGELFCEGSGKGEAHTKEGGDVIFNHQFQNFHLKLEWKISEGGNSGIFYLGQETKDYDYIWKTAPEMQVLDNEKHPDANAGKDGNRQAGSLYDLIPADPQNAKPAGEWNTAEVKVFKGSVWHIQNGETVLEYHLWTDDWKELVAGSKFPGLNENWADVASEGYFGVQDHGDDVWYRNIRIKEL
jgi:hypothetical protein